MAAMNRQLSICDFSVHQAEQISLRLLLCGQNFFQVSLRGFEFGLLGFLRSFVFGEQILDLRRRGVIVQRLLQRILFRAGLAEHAAASAAGVPPWPAAVLPAAIASEQSAHPSAADVTARVHDFLHERLHGAPVRVVGEIELVADIVHHALLHGRRVKISTATATAAAALTIAPLAAALAAVVVITIAITVVLLRENVADAQSQSGSNRAQGYDTIQFHRIFLWLVGGWLVGFTQ